MMRFFSLGYFWSHESLVKVVCKLKMKVIHYDVGIIDLGPQFF